MFGTTDRRHFMAHAAAGAAVTVPGLSFMAGLRSCAAELQKKQKSLIVLWMAGGPPTIDLWDMKPGTSTGGEHRPKPTAASGVQISEHLPNVAKQFKNLSIVRSDAGIMSIAAAVERPVNTVLSGPAGGVKGASAIAAAAGHSNIVSMDMGGTSTDVCLSTSGEPRLSTDTWVSHYPIRVPIIPMAGA